MKWKLEDGWVISCSTTDKVIERVRKTSSVFFYYTTMLKNFKPVALFLWSHQSLCPTELYIYWHTFLLLSHFPCSSMLFPPRRPKEQLRLCNFMHPASTTQNFSFFTSLCSYSCYSTLVVVILVWVSAVHSQLQEGN